MKRKIRVYLRAFEIDDHVRIHQWRNDREIARNFGGIPLFTSSLNEKKWLEDRIFDKNNVSCAICLKETSEFIGCIFLNKIDMHNRCGHVPVFIGEKSYWGKGYATDARILMLRYAFFDRGLNRVWARVLEDNPRAIKMHEKCGYRQEGILRASSFKDGCFINENCLGVLKEDFLPVLAEYEI
jgi:RimJ/RimL family protein N-acetyltransferase